MVATELATTMRLAPESIAACTKRRVPAMLMSTACSSVHQPREPARWTATSYLRSEICLHESFDMMST
eukprot:5694332-Pleurochrysis_carterae.AAC.1